MAKDSYGTMRHCYLIPVYNEEENLRLLHERLILHKYAEKNFYLFVDDCSSDGSVELLSTLFNAEDFGVITKKSNGGPGDSFNLGFNYLIDKFKTEENVQVITMEADNTSDLSILKDMVTISDLGYDLVLASIYAQGGGFSQTSFFRKTLSFGANMVFRGLFDVKILTLSSFYRVYHLNLIKQINDNNTNIIEQPGFICMFEILLKSIEEKAKVIEIPMILKSDIRKGKSKMKIFSNSISYIKFLLTYKSQRKAFSK